MYRKPLPSEKIYYTERPVNEHKCKEEYRKNYYMQNLRDDTPENLVYCCHILSLFMCDKISKFIF